MLNVVSTGHAKNINNRDNRKHKKTRDITSKTQTGLEHTNTGRTLAHPQQNTVSTNTKHSSDKGEVKHIKMMKEPDLEHTLLKTDLSAFPQASLTIKRTQ